MVIGEGRKKRNRKRRRRRRREREREREDTHVELPDGVRKYNGTEYGEEGGVSNRGFLF